MFTVEKFENLINSSDKPVLVFVSAEWCEPCKKANFSFNDLKYEYKDKLKFIKLDFDRDSDISNKYSIKGIPAFVLFKDGKASASQLGGAINKSRLSAFIDSNI